MSLSKYKELFNNEQINYDTDRCRLQSFEPRWNPVTRDNDSIPFLNIIGPEKYTVNTTYSLSNREFWKRMGLTSWSLLLRFL